MNSEAEKHLISGSSRPQPKVFYLLSIREASQKGHQKLRLINYCSECVLRKSCFQTFSGFGRPFCLVFFFGGGGDPTMPQGILQGVQCSHWHLCDSADFGEVKFASSC